MTRIEDTHYGCPLRTNIEDTFLRQKMRTHIFIMNYIGEAKSVTNTPYINRWGRGGRVLRRI